MKRNIFVLLIVASILIVFSTLMLASETKELDYDEAYQKALYFIRETKEYKKALPYLEIAIKTDISSLKEDVYFYIGRCNDELGNYSKAIEAFKQVIRINPNYFWVYYNLGGVYESLGLYKDAIEVYKQALHINPEDAFACHLLGINYYNLGLYKEAIEAFKQEIHINPDLANARLNLGLSYLKIGDEKLALNEYKILKELDINEANKLFDLIHSLGAFAQSEPLIPTNFTTYTDEVNLFSISYPENWEPAYSMIERFKQETSDYLKSIDEEGFSEINNVVFFGGILLDNGYYNPNISITILAKPLDDDNVKLEDVVEIMVPEYKKYSEEYRELPRTKTIIGGKQSIILDFEARLPNMPLAHYLVMYMFIDKYLWTTTCAIVTPLNYYDFKDDIYATLKSFKILK